MCTRITMLIAIMVFTMGCGNPKKVESKIPEETQVKVVTDKGTVVVRLYNETPLHRDNFIKLVKEQFYDSILFHRVIQNFVAQTGDPDSKSATSGVALGEGDLPYTVPAEFSPDLFNKRGVLGSARNGNIARASSSTQFSFIQGRVYTDSTLAIAQGRVNGWLAENAVLNAPENKEWATIWDAQARGVLTLSPDSLSLFKRRIDSLSAEYQKTAIPFEYPEAHREVYKTIGGAAHLDQSYTVFGEVVSGMEVIDSIAAVKTDERDRPIDDVRILRMEILK